MDIQAGCPTKKFDLKIEFFISHLNPKDPSINRKLIYKFF